MGSNPSIIANAFPQDVNVVVKNDSSTSKQLEEMSLKIPKHDLITVELPTNRAGMLYLTVLYHDREGKERKIVDNAPYNSRHGLIVTVEGRVVEACDSSNPWIDMSEVNHKRDPCPICHTLPFPCSLCLLESRLGAINHSIGVMKDCRIASKLIEATEKIKSNFVAEQQRDAKEMVAEIEKLAIRYWQLESKTKRAVGDIKIYGESLRKAAEHFMAKGSISNFWKELHDMEAVKESLKEANAEHKQVITEAHKLHSRAQDEVDIFKQREAEAVDDRETQMEYSVVSIPVLGQIIGGIGGACEGGRALVSACSEHRVTNNLPVKVVVGLTGGLACGAVGLVVTALSIPAAPYFWYQSVRSTMDARNYGVLKEEFANIVAQVELVEDNLGKITYCYEDVQQNLKLASKPEECSIDQLDERKRGVLIGRVIERSTTLMEACKSYFSLITSDQGPNFLTEHN